MQNIESERDIISILTIARIPYCFDQVDFMYFSQSGCQIRQRLLCIDRFGGFTRIRPIKVDWSIDGKIETGYHLAPTVIFSMV